VNAEVLEEHAASAFRDEVCRFTDRVGYICKLHGRLSWGPLKMGKGRNTAQTSSKKLIKYEWNMILLRKTLVYHHKKNIGMMRKNRSFQKSAHRSIVTA
jgi:hypothetical protein